MQITFSLPHVFYPGAPRDGDAYARRVLADCLVRLNQSHRRGKYGPALYQIDTCQVVFTLPSVFRPGVTPDANAHALRCLLDCLIQLNRGFLSKHNVPLLYDSGVFYHRTTVWDSIPALLQRGYGDCKSLTCAYVAEQRMRGIDCAPVFRWINRPDGSGATDFHILVLQGNGFLDPSKVLGMGNDEVAR